MLLRFLYAVQEAVGSQFTNGYPASPQGVAYSGPLASWNIAKAACHQQGFANATGTEMQRGHYGAAMQILHLTRHQSSKGVPS